MPKPINLNPVSTDNMASPAIAVSPLSPPLNVLPAIAEDNTKLPITMEQIGTIGSDIQTQISAVTSKITGVAKTSDMDSMGKLLTDTIMAAKGYDPNNLFKKSGFLGFFKAKASEVRMKFDSVDQTVDRLVAQVQEKIDHFKTRVTDLESLRQANEQYHALLTPEIKRISDIADWMENNQPPVDTTNSMSAQYVQDWLTVISFGRKRADDLRRAQILAEQQAAQIQQMKTNSTALAQKFGDIKVTTIPAMKQTFTLYVINMEQAKGAELANQIDDMTNQSIMRNAELLGKNTTTIHTALARSNISIEALQANYSSITNSLDEVKRIQNEMKQRLAKEGPELEKLSQDLSARLASK